MANIGSAGGGAGNKPLGGFKFKGPESMTSSTITIYKMHESPAENTAEPLSLTNHEVDAPESGSVNGIRVYEGTKTKAQIEAAPQSGLLAATGASNWSANHNNTPDCQWSTADSKYHWTVANS